MFPIAHPRRAIPHRIQVVVRNVVDFDGRRRISAVSEIVAFNEFEKSIELRPIFEERASAEPLDTYIAPTGCLPTFAGSLIRDGHIRLSLFLDGLERFESDGEKCKT